MADEVKADTPWHKHGRCDCPCGFAGTTRNIIKHRSTCEVWMKTWRADEIARSPVTHNPQEDAFYEKAEAASEKGQR